MLRRISGGAAVVAGPGCLMYAVVLSLRRRPALATIGDIHCFVLKTLCAALRPLLPDIGVRGASDMVLGERKVSGNSLRMRQGRVLYHGTLLYDFPLDLIARALAMPPRQPEYRRGRPHGDFLANLPLSAASIRRAVAAAWGAEEPRDDWPREKTAQLAAEKYSRDEWNCQR